MKQTKNLQQSASTWLKKVPKRAHEPVQLDLFTGKKIKEF